MSCRPCPKRQAEGGLEVGISVGVPPSAETPKCSVSLFRRLPRPGSARPAPPRVRRQESVEALTTDRWAPGSHAAVSAPGVGQGLPQHGGGGGAGGGGTQAEAEAQHLGGPDL